MKDFTRIVVILDRSGSMQSIREATVTGFNEFVRKQQQTPGLAGLKLVQFDDAYEVVFDTDIRDVPLLTQDTFVPRGMTALLDAQGRTITELGKELAAMPERERPSKVIVITLTDGLENRSTDYTVADVAKLVQHQREKYGWDFIYLGANQDAIKVAASMNIPASYAMNYSVGDPANVGATFAATSNLVRGVRASSRGVVTQGFSLEDRKDSMGEK
jgi:hypothetical protein